MVSGTKQMLNEHSQDEQLDENGAEAGLTSRGVWPPPLPGAAGEGLWAPPGRGWGRAGPGPLPSQHPGRSQPKEAPRLPRYPRGWGQARHPGQVCTCQYHLCTPAAEQLDRRKPATVRSLHVRRSLTSRAEVSLAMWWARGLTLHCA